ncbi:MAG TPA: hypothetical protein VIZ28_16980 [Chitinophagaceae bacterium]
MRYFLFLLLLITIIAGCSKKGIERTNFLELTVDGKKLSFDIKDTAVLDTVYPASFWHFTVYDNRSPYSILNWVLLSGSKWVNGNYEFPGEYFPGRSISYMDLTTYVNGPYEGYSLVNLYLNPFKITIDGSDNGRIHGTFSGTVTCNTCATPGTLVKITEGEFEMPYRFN